MDKHKSKVVGKFRCNRCGELATIRKAPERIKYRYSIKCGKCGYGAAFTQRIFNYIEQQDGYSPMESLAG